MRWLFFLLCCLAGCHKTVETEPKNLRINIGSDPETLDVRKARRLQSLTLCRMLFEGLTRISKEGRVELAIADRVEISEDGLQYRFFLKPTCWSNGDKLLASDFVEAWKTILDPQYPTDISYQLYCIKNAKKVKSRQLPADTLGVSSLSENLLLVELEQPTPYFLELCATVPFFPIPNAIVHQNSDWVHHPESFVGNGPFVLKEWKHADFIKVIKNNKYWDASAVKLDLIELVMVSPDTEIRLFEENQLHWAGSPLSLIPSDAVDLLKTQGQLRISPFSGTYFLQVNVNDPALQSPAVRNALARAIDRESIAIHLLQGGQIAARRLVPKEMGLSNADYFSDECGKAKALLVDEPKIQPVTISFCISDRNLAIAQAIQQQWKVNLGLQVILNPLEDKVFFEKLKKKEFQIAVGSWIADFNDPINFLEVFKFKDASTNNTGWESGKYIDLLERSAVCRDLEERKNLMRRAEEVLMAEMPVIPIFQYAINYLQNAHVKDVALSSIGLIDFRWAQIEE